MASFSASIVTKHEEGATFVFGPWLFVADQNGDLRREDRDDAAPTSGHPARITPRRPSIEFESDTISGSYPTRSPTSLADSTSLLIRGKLGANCYRHTNEATSKRASTTTSTSCCITSSPTSSTRPRLLGIDYFVNLARPETTRARVSTKSTSSSRI